MAHFFTIKDGEIYSHIKAFDISSALERAEEVGINEVIEITKDTAEFIMSKFKK